MVRLWLSVRPTIRAFRSTCIELHWAGVLSPGVPGVSWYPQILTDQLSLSQRGWDRLCPPHFYSPSQIFRPSSIPARYFSGKKLSTLASTAVYCSQVLASETKQLWQLEKFAVQYTCTCSAWTISAWTVDHRTLICLFAIMNFAPTKAQTKYLKP